MKTSRMLVAVSCAALLFGGAPSAFAQRGSGGHGGGSGGFHGGRMGMSRGGGGTSMVGHGGGLSRGVHSPFIHGARGPFIRGGGLSIFHGGFVHGGNFVQRGALVHGHGFVGPVRFLRPYYTFHPHVILGFGLWAGYPFAYPYAFYYPYYSYSYYPYPYVPNGYVSSYSNAMTDTSTSAVQPNQTNIGGMSFDITPSNAELFVDNVRVGTVGEFTPTTQPLGLEAGHHHVEIRAPGYQTMSLDVDITVGQVIPYQGSLER